MMMTWHACLLFLEQPEDAGLPRAEGRPGRVLGVAVPRELEEERVERRLRERLVRQGAVGHEVVDRGRRRRGEGHALEVRQLVAPDATRAVEPAGDVGVRRRVPFEQLREQPVALAAAQEALERRFAQGTRRLDRSYWKFWKEWCLMLGTPPLRINEAANSGAITHLHQREVVITRRLHGVGGGEPALQGGEHARAPAGRGAQAQGPGHQVCPPGDGGAGGVAGLARAQPRAVGRERLARCQCTRYSQFSWSSLAAGCCILATFM